MARKYSFFRDKDETPVDLDLCYITDRVLVMGSPYVNEEHLGDIRAFFELLHQNHVLICNFDANLQHIEEDFENVEHFFVSSSCPSSFSNVISFCSTVHNHLDSSPQNVVVAHCKTGLGRCCMMVACYLLHSGLVSNAVDAVHFLCRERTPTMLNALSVPSQIRYVHYYEQLLRNDYLSCYTYKIELIRMTTVPSFNSSIVYSGCVPYLKISCLMIVKGGEEDSRSWSPVYSQLDYEKKRKLKYESSSAPYVDFPLSSRNVCVRGDVAVRMFSLGAGRDEQICQICINTCFIEKNYLVFEKQAIDIACKDRKDLTYAPDFKIEIFFSKLVTEPELSLSDTCVETTSIEESDCS